MNRHLTQKLFSKPVYLIFVFLLFVGAGFSQKAIKDLKPTVILISLDGFRADYLDKHQPKTLKKLAKEGVRAKWMIPSFPSKTFPNHYTIATGLYPEHHGIVENNIYDFETVFSLSKREEIRNSRWWLGEPIWVTAVKQGQRAGAFFFPGTEAAIQGVRPTFWKEYDGKIPNETRIDTILSWLDLPQAERPTIYTLYFSDTDDDGHKYGPDSEQVKTAIEKIDGDLNRLLQGLKKRKIEKKVNLIIVSDHGMAKVDLNNAVFLDDLFDFDKTERILWTGEIVQIFPKEGEQSLMLNDLQKIQHAKCWDKANVPERFHYNEGNRIAPIICSAEEGWMLTSHQRFEDYKKREDFSHPHGAHGYDNLLESMRALFIAHGSAFKKKKIVEPFENVNVYNVMCRILKLTAAKNDGTADVANQILR